MIDNLLKLFPTRRVQPYDGMSITAKVWEFAHTYHYKTDQAHNLFFHGAGILVGMEVIASDPPDHLVYILPGIAVDPFGHIIVIPEPVAYDLGDEIEGPLHLMIVHRENPLTAAEKQISAGEPGYTQSEFLVIARTELPDSPIIELARFQRESRTSAIQDAQYPAHPLINEIDLRYRLNLDMKIERQFTAAVLYLGESPDKAYGLGLSRLADQIRHYNDYRLIVDDDLDFGPGILGYNLICMVGKGKFKFSKTQVSGLSGYLARGGTLLAEAGDAVAITNFLNLAKNLGLKTTHVSGDDPILLHPYLFPAAPPGFNSDPEVMIHLGTDQPGGFILTDANYGALWNGKGENRTPSREEIRSAAEWGINILAYIEERQSLSTAD